MTGTRSTFRIQRRGSKFVYRRRVPHDLRSALGRREIVRSLNTRQLREAQRRAAVLDAAVYALFDRMRDEEAAEAEERLIERLCSRYRRRFIRGDRQTRRRYPGEPDSESLGISSAMEAESEKLDRRQFSHVRPDAEVLLAEDGVELTGEALDGLLFELARTRLEAFSQMIQEREGDFIGRPRKPLQGETETQAPQSVTSALTLAELIRRYVEDHEGKTWAARTATMTKTGLAQFLEIVGDKPVRKVTKDDVREYRLTLEKLPARISSTPAYRGKSISDVLAMKPEPGLSPSSIHKLMAYAVALFNYAEKMEYVEASPARNMMPSKPRQEAERRDAFTDEDLALILSPEFRESALKGSAGGHHRYWIPLVMLFTGARLEEIAQLGTRDVVEVDGVPAIRITARSGEGEGGKSLKTPESERVVPIHSSLIELGFLAYAHDTGQGGHAMLFPMLEKTSNGYGAKVGKWFNGQWLRKRCGITNKRKVLYSTRHTFTTRLKAADVQDHTVSELVGHVVEGMTMGRYGKRLEVGRLRDGLERLDLTGPLGPLLGRES